MKVALAFASCANAEPASVPVADPAQRHLGRPDGGGFEDLRRAWR
jgi:hypothetical protein